MKTRHFLLFFLSLYFVCGNINAQDPLFDLMKTELDRNYDILKKEEIPAYYIFLRMEEIHSQSCSARFGKLQSRVAEPFSARYISSMLRVGDYTLDNTHEIREARENGGFVTGEPIPLEDVNPQTVKIAIWSEVDNLYKRAVQTYEQVKANIAVKVEQEDKSSDFSQEKVEKYYEAPLAFNAVSGDWEEKVKKYSAVFNDNKDILDGSAIFYTTLSRTWMVDTEGREIAQNKLTYHISLLANAMTDDGMNLPLYKSWHANILSELPSDEEVLREASKLSANLSALKKAPVVESFSGPAILSPDAAGVFFHEIFGHRVEGSRMKQEDDAQTFKKKTGESVLPKHLSVTFDPTMKSYGDFPLSGQYVYDDEGIKSQRVEVVKNGVLRNFLMCRTPIEGFPKSNGHGRAQLGSTPVSRQSNMLVESTQKYTEDQLRKMLIKEAKSHKLSYGYYFKEVSGGFTMTGRYMPNSFNVTPLMVYRIYVDGRPDELVRGVDLVGTPLAMFSQIEACGSDYAVFNGTCGAESGGIPVSCLAPSIFVKRIETQKSGKDQSQPPVLSRPVVDQDKTSSQQDGQVILSSIKEEVDRGMKGLKMDRLQPPFFIAYAIEDAKAMTITATLGSIVNSRVNTGRSSTCRFLMGDYQCTDENFSANVGGNFSYDGNPCIENDKEGIRYTVWRDLDALYKRAAETYEQKISAIKQLNIPKSSLELPDWDKTPVVNLMNLPERKISFDKEKYEQYAKEASAVFAEYEDILNSDVSILISSSSVYFYNTENSEYRLPRTFGFLNVNAGVMTDEGETVGDSFNLILFDPADFPDMETLKADCRRLAEKVLAMKKASVIEESYAGPVMFEGLAVAETFYGNFLTGNTSLIAARKTISPAGFLYGGNALEEMMDKRITAKEISIEDLTGTKEYAGQPLLGYAPVDAQGVIPPEKLTLVENGILKTLLNDRVPTQKVPHSNGHDLYGMGLSAGTKSGVIRMVDTRTKSQDDLRKELLERAKSEGYEYAYIVRKSSGGGSTPDALYRVSVKDGSEQLIRSARLNNIDSQIFKKIIAVSDKEVVHNIFISSPTTVIVPQAILFDEMEIQKDTVDNYQKPPIVPQP